MTDQAFTITTPSDTPADLIEQSKAVLQFLNLTLGETRELNLQEEDTFGLCLILGAVENALDQASKAL